MNDLVMTGLESVCWTGLDRNEMDGCDTTQGLKQHFRVWTEIKVNLRKNSSRYL